MEFELYSHRYSLEIIDNNPNFKPPFDDFLEVIRGIDENKFRENFKLWLDKNKSKKSVSTLLNKYLDEMLPSLGWDRQSKIFKDPHYSGSRNPWKLDFSYKDIYSMEVAFNNSGSTISNLLKPVLASELNHVEKQFQTKIGIVVTATQEFKEKGGFDSAVGTYEKYIEHLLPLMNQITVPMVIVGLKPFNTFQVLPKQKGIRDHSEIIINGTL